MKTYKSCEKEIDERLALDKRRDSKAFYRYFDSEEVLPAGFHHSQDEIRKGLENEFWKNFQAKGNDVRLSSWRKPDNQFFFFPADLMNCELIKLEISQEILSDKLIGIIMSYLEKRLSRYCVNVAVYKGMQRGSEYLGRFIINLDEIAVEESLAGTWSEQVKFMPLEEKTNTE